MSPLAPRIFRSYLDDVHHRHFLFTEGIDRKLSWVS